MKRGIIYIACDSRKYLEEAARSAATFKTHCDNIHTTVYTDIFCTMTEFDEVVEIDNLIPDGKTSQNWCEGERYFKAKIDILAHSPYEETLYLDGDTCALNGSAEMFGLLKKFDIAVAHDSCRWSKWSDKLDIPRSYPDMNCGLLLYRRSTTGNFFRDWTINYESHPQPHDQPAFRLTAWRSTDVRLAILPPEYNIRPSKFHYMQEPKVIHGRGEGFLPEVRDASCLIYL